MGCGCGGSNAAKAYVWTSADGSKKVEKRTEVEVKALVIRQGGTYEPKPA